ncbi:lipid kinase [Nocardioides aquiterrae]|uniref:Lipid kinase n=1 Tax=Nocardioides aquiterrae TaxID=203799 RepID=A0ABP4EUW2_9ACTN
MGTDAGLGPAALVVNTASRRGADAFPVAREALPRHGIELGLTRAVTDPSTLPDVVREAATSGYRLVVVGGGDGTLSGAAGVLAGLPRPYHAVLGVLPLGTANDFARTLHIPPDVEAASRVVATGKVVDIDLGRANDRAFLNVASLGLSVEVARESRPALKRWLGPAAYPVAALLAYRRHRPFQVRLEFPDGEQEPLDLGDLLQLGVGNGRHYGGGATVAPDAGIDDHLLDVFAIEKGRLRDHVTIAGLLRSGRFVEHEKVRHLTTTQVVVTTDGGEQEVNLDGEIGTATPARFRVQSNVLDVVVPQHARDLRREARRE